MRLWKTPSFICITFINHWLSVTVLCLSNVCVPGKPTGVGVQVTLGTLHISFLEPEWRSYRHTGPEGHYSKLLRDVRKLLLFLVVSYILCSLQKFCLSCVCLFWLICSPFPTTFLLFQHSGRKFFHQQAARPSSKYAKKCTKPYVF